MFCFAVSICAFSSPICVSAILQSAPARWILPGSSERPGSSVSKALRRASAFSSTFAFCAAALSLAAEAAACACVICGFCAFYLFLCGSVLRRAPPGAGAPRSRRPGRGFRLAGCLQECPPARPEMPAASGCMPEAARLPPVPARDTPFVFLQRFLLCMQVFIIRDQIFRKSSCDWSICRSSASWNTSNWTSLNIWITTATTGSRQNGRACRPRFTEVTSPLGSLNNFY